MTTLSTHYQSYKVFFLIIKVLWATKALLLPSFDLTSPFLHPPALTLISMDATATSFHTPYSCWPPRGVIINENHFNFHVNGRQTSYSMFFKLLHTCRQNYFWWFLAQKPIHYNKFCLMMCCHPICMMSCMFVLNFIPNINSIKQYNINIKNL